MYRSCNQWIPLQDRYTHCKTKQPSEVPRVRNFPISGRRQNLGELLPPLATQLLRAGKSFYMNLVL